MLLLFFLLSHSLLAVMLSGDEMLFKLSSFRKVQFMHNAESRILPVTCEEKPKVFSESLLSETNWRT